MEIYKRHLDVEKLAFCLYFPCFSSTVVQLGSYEFVNSSSDLSQEAGANFSVA